MEKVSKERMIDEEMQSKRKVEKVYEFRMSKNYLVSPVFVSHNKQFQNRERYRERKRDRDRDRRKETEIEKSRKGIKKYLVSPVFRFT